MEGPVKTNKLKGKKIKDWFVNQSFELVSFAILTVGLLFFSLHRQYDISQPIDGGLWGQYGDYVGGLLGTLLAYMSVKLLSRNLHEQIIANKELRISNENSQRVAALQQFDSSFSTLIDMYRDCQGQVKGLDMQWSKNYSSSEKDYRKRVDQAIDAYLTFFMKNHSLLSSYYRLLYRIMQTIDEAAVDNDIKRRYAKIFRCQISEEELILLRYNAFTHYGKKMQVYINRYNLLKHLPKMHLLEFKDPSILAMVDGQAELFDRFIVEIRRKIIEGISVDGIKEPELWNSSNKIELENLDIVFAILKSSVKIDLVYVMPKGTGSKAFDDPLQSLLTFYILETFVYASFGCYQSISSVDITSDIRIERQYRKHTVWVQLKSKNDYALVLSPKQLDRPQKGL